ncbi:MAG: GIY-YIG nuclease family protein [Terriglobales bacterium]
MREPKRYYAYILASISGTLYIGITSALKERVFKHKEGLFDGFRRKYSVNRLVYFESFDDVRTAIDREKQLKGWRRAKKIALIERINSQWKDLSAEWYLAVPSG